MSAHCRRCRRRPRPDPPQAPPPTPTPTNNNHNHTTSYLSFRDVSAAELAAWKRTIVWFFKKVLFRHQVRANLFVCGRGVWGDCCVNMNVYVCMHAGVCVCACVQV